MQTEIYHEVTECLKTAFHTKKSSSLLFEYRGRNTTYFRVEYKNL